MLRKKLGYNKQKKWSSVVKSYYDAIFYITIIYSLNSCYVYWEQKSAHNSTDVISFRCIEWTMSLSFALIWSGINS